MMGALDGGSKDVVKEISVPPWPQYHQAAYILSTSSQVIRPCHAKVKIGPDLTAGLGLE